MDKQKLLALVNERLNRQPALTEADYETSLNDLGVDSLDRMLILVAVQETFGVSIPDEKAAQITSLQSLEDLITV